MQPKSKYFKHFAKVDDKHVHCKICQKIYKYSRGSPTSSLKKHLDIHSRSLASYSVVNAMGVGTQLLFTNPIFSF